MFLKQLKSLVENEKNVYTLDELLNIFESNNIAVFLVLVTIITSIPLPPWGGGFETIPGGVLSIFLALQGLVGMKKAYFPSFIRNIEFDLGFVKKSKYTKKTIEWFDETLKEDRYKWVLNDVTEKIMYLLVIPNALLMIVPILFTNGPPSQCITLLTMSWLLHDGFYFLLMIGISILVVLMYIVLFFMFGNFLYKTRKCWTFGLWK